MRSDDSSGSALGFEGFGIATTRALLTLDILRLSKQEERKPRKQNFKAVWMISSRHIESGPEA